MKSIWRVSLSLESLDFMANDRPLQRLRGPVSLKSHPPAPPLYQFGACMVYTHAFARTGSRKVQLNQNYSMRNSLVPNQRLPLQSVTTFGLSWPINPDSKRSVIVMFQLHTDTQCDIINQRNIAIQNRCRHSPKDNQNTHN